MNTTPPAAAAASSPERPDAFVLTGSFLVVCRAPQYLSELSRRGLKILLITPSAWRDEAHLAMKDPSHPASAIHEVAFVDGDVARENSYLPGVVSAGRRWREAYHIVGAYAVGETQVEPTGLLADALDLPSPGLRATRACRSKYLQRWYLPDFSPASLVLAGEERDGVDAEAVTYPAVVKPAGRHSSSGVATVEGPDALRAMLATYPPYETVLVEEKIAGQEYSVESLVQDGRVIFASATRKDTTDSHAHTFVELSHTVPSDRPDADEALLDANARMLRGLGFRDGIAHSEWRIDATGRAYLMEVAARTPGDGLCVLYELATGAPLEPEIVKIALGEPAAYPAPRRVARQVYLEHDPGVLQDVTLDGFDVVPAWVGDGGLWPRIEPGAHDDAPTLRAVFVHKDRGARLGPLNSSEDRAVSFFIDAPTVEGLDALEERVRAALTISTSSTSSTSPSVPDTVTHVLVGYSPVMLGKLDERLPAGSVLVLEEPAVIAARDLADLADRHACVGALLPAPSQDEQHPDRIAASVPRPPRVRVVVPVVEYAVVVAAALAEAWGLPGAGPKAARVLRDKGLLRAALTGTSIAQPVWEIAESAEDVAAFRAARGGRCVLKPANRQASLGVQLLGPDDDVSAAWAHTTTADEPTLRAPKGQDTDRFLVEQLLTGPEVSVEAVVHEGVVGFTNITAKNVQDSRYPVETGHTVPADLPEETADALREALVSLAGAVDFRSGVLHSEWILHEGRPHLVECAGRLPGGGITVLIDLAYDTDILDNLLYVLEGEGRIGALPARQGAAVRFLAAAPGEVREVTGAAEAGAAEGVHMVHLAVAPGATVLPTTSSWERAGFVIATGADGAAAGRHAERAAALIAVRTEPGDGESR
ncbi:ATP-grasp domain-containing protein [Streptomyces sp. APSN-46.1]|uniref:ATP-grasp domain-containing protein n=1 Tax=Streptomyces sp. APSN-46.1 TaxID=2929049 RepID=UPI001FB56169|nr:ATP-grasp domain-containing protein [Streptomyces sp. APSN-46.1]MCJ1678232.1 ATP-grasp domain-containing protein [Streptomyces sp. APSN-46.1]